MTTLEIVTYTVPSNGNVIEYKRLANGTCYHVETPDIVVQWLETARERNQRIRIFYGDTQTGRDWCEEYETIGYIGRSSGNLKVPLMLANSASHGGGAILDHCIVRITIDKNDVYRHPNYHNGEWKTKKADSKLKDEGYVESVYRDNENVANFKKPGQAERFIEFMKGNRNSK